MQLGGPDQVEPKLTPSLVQACWGRGPRSHRPRTPDCEGTPARGRLPGDACPGTVLESSVTQKGSGMGLSLQRFHRAC